MILSIGTKESYTQWVKASDVPSVVVNAVAFDNMNVYAAMFGLVFRSADNGTNWLGTYDHLLSGDLWALVVHDGILFIGEVNNYGHGGIYSSTDNGFSWKSASSGLGPGNSTLALASVGTRLLAGTGGGIFSSTDDGANWTLTNTGVKGFVRAFVTTETKIFASTDSGIFVSMRDDTSWNRVSTGSLTSTSCLAADDTDIFIQGWMPPSADGIGVYVSKDSGATWQPTGLFHTYVRCMLKSGTNLFAGPSYGTQDGIHYYDGGIYLSTDNGTNWIPVNLGGLDGGQAWTMGINGGRLFAAVGDGLWYRSLSEMITSVNQSPSGLPTAIRLDQNYPNPFNPSTAIRYELPMASQVTLSVFDILGRQVTVLVNERREAGVHEVKFDGSNLASGVYFYRLAIGDFVQTRRFLLLK